MRALVDQTKFSSELDGDKIMRKYTGLKLLSAQVPTILQANPHTIHGKLLFYLLLRFSFSLDPLLISVLDCGLGHRC